MIRISNRVKRGLWTNRDVAGKEAVVMEIVGKLDGLFVAELLAIQEHINALLQTREHEKK